MITLSAEELFGAGMATGAALILIGGGAFWLIMRYIENKK